MTRYDFKTEFDKLENREFAKKNDVFNKISYLFTKDQVDEKYIVGIIKIFCEQIDRLSKVIREEDFDKYINKDRR